MFVSFLPSFLFAPWPAALPLIQDVRTQNVTAATAIANIVKSSLGPVGLDKMLVDEVSVILGRFTQSMMLPFHYLVIASSAYASTPGLLPRHVHVYLRLPGHTRTRLAVWLSREASRLGLIFD